MKQMCVILFSSLSIKHGSFCLVYISWGFSWAEKIYFFRSNPPEYKWQYIDFLIFSASFIKCNSSPKVWKLHMLTCHCPACLRKVLPAAAAADCLSNLCLTGTIASASASGQQWPAGGTSAETRDARYCLSIACHTLHFNCFVFIYYMYLILKHVLLTHFHILSSIFWIIQV